jgi:hypothetical protein
MHSSELLAVDGASVALLRKLILSMETWNKVACPVVSISISFRKPSNETYVLSKEIGFLVFFIFV